MSYSPGDFLDMVQQFAPDPQKGPMLATVDAAYLGVGNPKVTFDSETGLTTRTYPFLGNTPAAGSRVLMQPAGGSWVIAGAVDGATAGAYKDIKPWELSPVANLTNLTATPSEVCRVVMSDPGWPYFLCAGGVCTWAVAASTQWDASMVVGTTAGAAISKRAIGNPGALTQNIMGFFMGATVFTGSKTAIMILSRQTGTGAVTTAYDSAFTGGIVLQVPA